MGDACVQRKIGRKERTVLVGVPEIGITEQLDLAMAHEETQICEMGVGHYSIPVCTLSTLYSTLASLGTR